MAGSCMAVTVVGASVSACITAEEAAADQVRFIDMQLRVAALKCRNKEPRMVTQYNRFVEAHRPAIIASRAPVERYIGRQTKLTMDDYVTERANRLSYESIGVREFCRSALALAATAARAADATVVLDLLPVRYRLPTKRCRPSGDVATNLAPSAMDTLGSTSKGN